MDKKELIKELKDMLVGVEISEDNYSDDLNKFLNKQSLELNDTDFDYDRIYKEGYVFEGWEENYIASIEKEYTTRSTLKDGVVYDEDIVRIIDIF